MFKILLLVLVSLILVDFLYSLLNRKVVNAITNSKTTSDKVLATVIKNKVLGMVIIPIVFFVTIIIIAIIITLIGIKSNGDINILISIVFIIVTYLLGLLYKIVMKNGFITDRPKDYTEYLDDSFLIGLSIQALTLLFLGVYVLTTITEVLNYLYNKLLKLFYK